MEIQNFLKLIKKADIIAVKKYIKHNIDFINEIIDTTILFEAIKTKNTEILKIILQQIVKHNLIHLIEYAICYLTNVNEIIFLLTIIIKLNLLTKELLLVVIELQNKEIILAIIDNIKFIDIEIINYLLITQNINIIALFLNIQFDFTPFIHKLNNIHHLCDNNTSINTIKIIIKFYKKYNLNTNYLENLLDV